MTEAILVLLILKVALDFYSFKHPSIWFDLIYIVILAALGISSLNSPDPHSVMFGWVAIGTAVCWFVYACLRETGWTERLGKKMGFRKKLIEVRWYSPPACGRG